ncbi:hypothetical protein D3C80_1628660 [compost metagenome]
MVSLVLVIILRQMERVIERMTSVQGRSAPWINQLLPGCADCFILEFPVIEQVKGKQLVRTQRELRSTVRIKPVCQIRVSRSTEIGGKMLF